MCEIRHDWMTAEEMLIIHQWGYSLQSTSNGALISTQGWQVIKQYHAIHVHRKRITFPKSHRQLWAELCLLIQLHWWKTLNSQAQWCPSAISYCASLPTKCCFKLSTNCLVKSDQYAKFWPVLTRLIYPRSKKRRACTNNSVGRSQRRD